MEREGLDAVWRQFDPDGFALAEATRRHLDRVGFVPPTHGGDEAADPAEQPEPSGDRWVGADPPGLGECPQCGEEHQAPSGERPVGWLIEQRRADGSWFRCGVVDRLTDHPLATQEPHGQDWRPAEFRATPLRVLVLPERRTQIDHYPIQDGRVVVRWRGATDPDGRGYIVEANVGGVIVEGAGHYGTDLHAATAAGRLLAARLEREGADPDTHHEFRIVGDEDALIVRCGDASIDHHPVGIYEDLAEPCPGCGQRFVLDVTARLRATDNDGAG